MATTLIGSVRRRHTVSDTWKFYDERDVRFRRKNYKKTKSCIDHPYLIEIQKKSYENFLQRDIPTEKRKDQGLHAVFNSVFPIFDFSETSSVEFVSYSFEPTKYTVNECRQRGMSYAAPLKIVIRLVIWDTENEDKKVIIDIMNQDG